MIHECDPIIYIWVWEKAFFKFGYCKNRNVRFVILWKTLWPIVSSSFVRKLWGRQAEGGRKFPEETCQILSLWDYIHGV